MTNHKIGTSFHEKITLKKPSKKPLRNLYEKFMG